MKYNEILKEENKVLNHEGARAFRMTPEMELYTAAVTSALSGKFYESPKEFVGRISTLVGQVDPMFVAQLAVYTRTVMNLRSIPLLLLVELAKVHSGDDIVSRAVSKTVLRADEISELLMCYQWRNPAPGVKKLGKLSRQIQNGLKEAFNRFDEYQFAKYDRKDAEVKLKDALFLVHPKAKDAAQQVLFDKIVADTLQTPYTWETQLSALGQQKFETPEEKQAAVKALWEELLDSGILSEEEFANEKAKVMAKPEPIVPDAEPGKPSLSVKDETHIGPANVGLSSRIVLPLGVLAIIVSLISAILTGMADTGYFTESDTYSFSRISGICEFLALAAELILWVCAFNKLSTMQEGERLGRIPLWIYLYFGVGLLGIIVLIADPMMEGALVVILLLAALALGYVAYISLYKAYSGKMRTYSIVWMIGAALSIIMALVGGDIISTIIEAGIYVFLMIALLEKKEA